MLPFSTQDGRVIVKYTFQLIKIRHDPKPR